MTSNNLIPTAILKRKAVVYVRQSTPQQVQVNLESQRRQYELVDVARRWGFRKVEVIDEDLGRTASGAVERPGFERLVDDLCTGQVGAVLCLEASRLSRNGPDWHRLLELWGEVDARVIDLDGVYDPGLPNDRLLLGMKGSISEFELGILRARMYGAARAKAERGELRISVPFGYSWHRDYGLGFDPDMRLQETIRLVFARFRELGSARQVLISMTDDGVHFPRPSDGKKMVSFDWVPIRYRNVISTLKNPFYAGAYVYGKSEKRTEIVDGRVRKSYGHYKPTSEWAVVLKDHHEGYIEWSEYERNQELLAANAYGKTGGVKSGRGGRALLPGLISCGRCGRRLVVIYAGRGQGYPVYRCDRGNLMLATTRCMSFNGFRTDAAVAREALEAVAPMAIEAALEAERMQLESEARRRQMIELDLQQARYEASLAERRYAACDPENRLIAAQLEKSWEATLRRVEACEARLSEIECVEPVDAVPDFGGLAQDLEAAWNAPGVDMRCRQQLLRALIKDIVADVDDEARDVILTIHWHGGQHSQVRVRKPKTGEHGQHTPAEALAIMRSMATRWSDADIAATLSRMGMQTGHGKTWTARRVQSLRTVHGARCTRSAVIGLPTRTANGSPCRTRPPRSESRTSKSDALSGTASCPPSRSCAVRPIKSAPATLKTNGSRPNWRAKSRVAPKMITRNRCFPPFEKEVHNESAFPLGRKSWLFVGSDRGGDRAAFMYTLIGTAKLDDVDPLAWLADALGQIADISQARLHELFPWNWTPAAAQLPVAA